MLNPDDIPINLQPVVNQIANELYRLRGYDVKADFDFWTATHPQEKEALAGAIAAFQILHDYCMDTVGQSFLDFFEE